MRKKYLILNTADSFVLNMLLQELKPDRAEIHCLIQDHLFSCFQEKHADILFTNSGHKSLYNLSQDISDNLRELYFDTIFVPVSAVRATNYGFVLAIINRLRYGKIIFYNGNGEQSVIQKKSRFQERIIRLYIGIIDYFYTGQIL